MKWKGFKKKKKKKYKYNIWLHSGFVLLCFWMKFVLLNFWLFDLMVVWLVLVPFCFPSSGYEKKSFHIF